ncbi:MAG: hypothetical protein ACKO23_10190, partial [Gemmataceae bacterium]
ANADSNIWFCNFLNCKIFIMALPSRKKMTEQLQSFNHEFHSTETNWHQNEKAHSKAFPHGGDKGFLTCRGSPPGE